LSNIFDDIPAFPRLRGIFLFDSTDLEAVACHGRAATSARLAGNAGANVLYVEKMSD
jgi:hypothetical protein